jgi:hypothetical protein
MAIACGGGGSKRDEAWPPDTFGGTIVLDGPLDDPALDPLTGRIYDDVPICEGPITPLDSDERIELNGGANVSLRDLRAWEGSYVCTLGDMGVPGPTLGLDVRLAGDAAATCQRREGGQLMAPAVVSIQLTDTDGTMVQTGSCTDFGTVTAWPNGTNLRVDCGVVTVEIRTGWVRIDRLVHLEIEPESEALDTTTTVETVVYYGVECEAASGD